MQSKTFIRRAAMMLALMVLTTVGALAEDLIYVGYLDPTAPIGMQRKTVLNPEGISYQTVEIGTADTETWYYVSGEFTNSNRIVVLGTVNLILADGCNFTVSNGIHVPSGSALNIYAQSIANRGSLTANNYVNDAAIGGDGGEDESGNNATDGEDSGAITIYGGTITTYGNIGGGDGGNGTMEPGEYSNEPGYGGDGGNGNVTIYSGYIRVNGNIGGGSGGTGQDDFGSDDPYNYGSNGGGTVNLSWTNTEDRIYAYCYYGTVTLQKAFTVGNEVHDAGELNNNQDINGATLMYAGTYYIVTIGDMPEGVTATADLELNAELKDAVEGQVVTIGFSGVPAGKVPVATVNYTNAYGDQTDNVIDNGDGTYSFTMPAANVTITVELKKDIANCTATVPDQFPNGNSLMMYKFENANSGNAVIGETVKDGETTLTLGTDYVFGSVTFANGDPDPYQVGDECVVTINGIGDYAGSIDCNFEIVASANGEWGDLTWSLENGAFNIGLTTPANGNKTMNETTREGYPWHAYGSYITSITIGEGVLDVAANAFAGTSGVNTYGSVTTVSLPSTLTSIGENAFAYCGATMNLDNIISQIGISNIGLNAFNQVAKLVGMLTDNADNTNKINLLSSAQRADVTISGRTLTKDGKWNTLCLPFDLSAEQIAWSPLASATIKEMDNSVDGTKIDNEGKLTLAFKDATSIEARKPYIIMWADGDNITDPTFEGVDVDASAPIAVTSYDGKVKFVGSYNPYASTGSAFLKESNDASAQNAFRAFVKVNSEESIYSNQACTEAATVLQAGNSMVYYVKNTFVLTEAEGVTELVTHAGATNQLVSFTRSGLTANAYSTMCLPFSFKAPSACTFYAFTGIEWNSTNHQWEATITQQAANATLNAHTPYIFKCAENEATFTSTIATVAASYGDTELSAGAVTATTGDDQAWTFKGTYTALDWTSAAPAEPTYGFSTYVPYNEGNTAGIAAGTFVRFVQGASLAPFRARLLYSGDNNILKAPRRTSEELPQYIVVRIVDADGTVTAIGSLNTKTGELNTEGWYTLNGMKLNSMPTQRGIYIHNGKKIMVK
jgi:hypothetical protein